MSVETGRSWLSDLLRKHPALLISALYVVASTIGMMFSWDYLRRFGINVFNYAQIGDFLLASLKEPMTWGLVILAGILVMADNMSSRRWQKKEHGAWTRWYGSPRYRRINYLLALILVVIFLDAYASQKAKETYEGQGKLVEFRLSDSNTRRSAILLGTTAQFVFLFDSKTQKVFVHPHESIASISFVAPGPSRD